MPEEQVSYLVECVVVPEGTTPGMAPTIKHPVAIFADMAAAQEWSAECLHCGRLAHKLQHEEPQRFAATLDIDPLQEQALAEQARKQEGDPRQLLWQLKLESAAQLNPYDPQMVLTLQMTGHLGRFSIVYTTHELQRDPEPPAEDVWETIYPDAADALPLPATDPQ